jgi:hypothetical protein
MKQKTTFLLLFAMYASTISAQILPASRSVDWSKAGLTSAVPNFGTTIDLDAAGLTGDGVTPNDAALQAVLSPLGNTPTILQFSAGVYLFSSRIQLPNNVILRGRGADSTTLKSNLGGSNHSIQITGSQTISDSTYLVANAAKGDNFADVTNASRYPIGAYIRIMQNDSAQMFSTWAYKTLGQIVRVDSSAGNRIYFSSPLRRDYALSQNPYFVRINPKINVGIECLTLDRVDPTAGQTSSIFMQYAADCWVKGIESNFCNNAHINLMSCTNIDIRNNYLHHAHSYGGGGQGYGVILQATTGEALMENNIFRHLRHSLLFQSGANGNVAGYNYSTDPYWNENFFPTNAAGDLVLHGNYPYSNLFEGNIVQNIVIDVSHEANGEHNTFFRNRAELYGIFFSGTTSPNQNFIANDVTNNSNGLYTIQGIGHFEYANRFRGTVMPTGTDATPLADMSYYRASRPDFLPTASFAAIGLPNANGNGSLPAFERDLYNERLANVCDEISAPRIGFAQTTPIVVAENAGFAQVPIRISNVNDFATDVQIGFLPASTTATEGTDFANFTGGFLSYTWQPMDNQTAMLQVQILDDQITENTETIRLVLRNASNGGIITADSTVFIQITDNDAVSVDEQTSPISETIIYPNPTDNQLFVRSNTEWEYATVCDVLGRQWLQTSLTPTSENQFDINIRPLPAGLYILRLHNGTTQQSQYFQKK